MKNELKKKAAVKNQKTSGISFVRNLCASSEFATLACWRLAGASREAFGLAQHVVADAVAGC